LTHHKAGLVARVSDARHGAALPPIQERSMKALQDFLTTDYGLMSLAVIAITLGMGVFYGRFFASHMKADTEAARARGEIQ
jgi:hypothetical protein